MQRVLDAELNGRIGAKANVLDVGSMLVACPYPRTFREIMRPAWKYTGCDIAPGENVDLVQSDATHIQKRGACYDLVISANCLEHVERPWLFVPEIVRMLRPRGVLILSVPWHMRIHRYPLDCWRILPDGMQVLLSDAGLENVKTWTHDVDCWGIGLKGES